MIIDNLKYINSYFDINNKIYTAIEYLKELEIEKISVGKYMIDDEIFALVSEYETHEEVEGLWEAHREYIDIQYIAKGVEKIGYCAIDKLSVSDEYNQNLDVVLGHAEGDFVTLFKGDFMILFPQDAHKPGNLYHLKSKVKKVVVKVKI